MPTGYTAGILDGTIATFEQFAKLCTRAFGATIHMRDEPLSAPFEPAKPSDYYYDRAKEASLKHEAAMIASDEEIIANEKARILEGIKHAEKQITKQEADKKKLAQMLQEAENWEPPKGDYAEFKRFITDQLVQTIQFDTSGDYYERSLEEYKAELADLNPEKLRIKLLEEASQEYHRAQKSLKEEIARCESRNKWVETLWQSLTPQTA